jgi:hypothetical protein
VAIKGSPVAIAAERAVTTRAKLRDPLVKFRAILGSPALSMTTVPLWLRTNEKLLDNADRGAGWRPPIIESAGEPIYLGS